MGITTLDKSIALPRTKPFLPDLVFFEPKSLEYELGDKLYRKFKEMDIPIKRLNISRRRRRKWSITSRN